jgi:hypothetical protein
MTQNRSQSHSETVSSWNCRAFSDFWRWRRQVSCTDWAIERLPLVRSIAKWRIPRMSAATNRHGRSSCQAERFPVLIHHFKVPFNANRTIAEHRHFRSCHDSSVFELSSCLPLTTNHSLLDF